MTDEITTMRLIIAGRVQGVNFRAFVMHEADALGLNGWVRNRTDGTVETLVSGPDAVVKEFVGKCARGPAAARVSHLDIERAEAPSENGFTCKPTV